LPVASGLHHLRFRCTSCGNCCRDLRVPLTSADLRRLVRASGKPARAIVEWLPSGSVDLIGEPGSLVVLEQPTKRVLMALKQDEGACLFLGGGALCGVYDARPGNCRLFPFDASFGPRGGIRRLRLLGGTRCDQACDGHNDAHALRTADAQRWAEHRAYLQQIQLWNRSQRHRERFGHALLGAEEYLDFLERPASSEQENGS